MTMAALNVIIGGELEELLKSLPHTKEKQMEEQDAIFVFPPYFDCFLGLAVFLLGPVVASQ
ncbi:hypothetical protein HPP92_012429 [Vanilla planifolia]|uniref:Uncharacterized protein n=1 Tax=Vanilla planifolia TaxID=51239 RepID=A0A835V3B8_VANPL|nr:hypothetical protein HPP92_012429 [Vanilla planifolia]